MFANRPDDIDGEGPGNPPTRHRWIWLAAVLGALLIFAALALVAPAANADYRGSRWEHAGRAVCVTTKYIKTTAVKDAVKRSVGYWNSETVLDVRTRNDCYASGYSQRIVVYDRYYGKIGKSGWVEWKGGFKWFQSKTAGPWTVNGWTYAHRSPVIVKVNRSYTDGSSRWRQHVVSHEIGHALGLDHAHTNRSVMTSSNRDYFVYGGYWDFKGTVEHPGINRIYGKG